MQRRHRMSSHNGVRPTCAILAHLLHQLWVLPRPVRFLEANGEIGLRERTQPLQPLRWIDKALLEASSVLYLYCWQVLLAFVVLILLGDRGCSRSAPGLCDARPRTRQLSSPVSALGALLHPNSAFNHID
jgi:hypothetical protein